MIGHKKVTKNDAGTNRLVFFSPLRERGRERHSHTHTHTGIIGPWFCGSGGKNSTSAMDAWERHGHPPFLRLTGCPYTNQLDGLNSIKN